MATKDTGQPANGISRRAFLTSTAVAATAVGCGFDVAYDAEKAFAYENYTADYKVTTTTCPYCSASCGQRVVDTATHRASAGKIVDIYGDFESPMNSGGLCAKGAGSIQLVNNTAPHRRVAGLAPERQHHGRWTTIFAADTTTYHRRRRLQAHRQRRLEQGALCRLRSADIADRTGQPLAARVHRRRRLQQQGRRVPRLVSHEQRAELHVPQDHRELRYQQRRASGPYLTLVHGGRSGRRIRTRRNDEPLGRYRQLDQRRRLGRQPGREPPGMIAHINRGASQAVLRASDPRSSKKAAKLIVIDPRKTRTALQAGQATCGFVPAPTSPSSTV